MRQPHPLQGVCAHGTSATPHDAVLAKVLRLISEEVLTGDFPERVTRDVESHAAEARARRGAETERLTKRIGELEASLARAAYRLATVADDMVSAVQEGIRQAREEQAKREGKKPEEIDPDIKGLNFDPSIQHLQAALKINNGLWRAHFYLARIYRMQDKPQLTAQEFTAAKIGRAHV